MSDMAERIDGLEMRLAHQEKTISDLNEMITAQWRKIEALERGMTRLHEEMETLDQVPNANERPPHY
jgi:SlyX protein